ncbi:MAG: SGNH/GDSL hydrolase family protein [Saccharofermentans sp.]|nr:SGNH/GDSL hydrolase family protein [Saccharofermentans sp.]
MNKNQYIALGIVLLSVVFVCGICFGYFLGSRTDSMQQTEETQSSSVISSSETSAEQTATSESETSLTSESESETTESETTASSDTETLWLEDGYNYLAIGNSITQHGISSYWWNEIGMAASDEEHDYYHLVLKHIEENKGKTKGISYNFYIWETQSHDRDEALELLDQYLSPELDLITVQLGENAGDLTTFQKDYVSLLQYIRSKAPNARILVLGDFWISENRDELKAAAAAEANVEFVSLDGIASNEEYYCGLGTVVYDAEGNEHIVEHDGVARHPGDNGMKAIADRIIATLDQ